MINQRLINNLTNMTIKATLYIQENNNLNNIYGTVNITLQANESREVEYGDLRNNFLLGLRIYPLPEDLIETYYAVVKQRGDSIDTWLNNSDTIDITIKRLHSLDSHQAVEQLVHESNMV